VQGGVGMPLCEWWSGLPPLRRSASVGDRKVNYEIQTILSAAHFAAEKHANQKRKGAAGEPYINHLLEVAQLVSSAISEPDPNLVIAALLHDTIEDAGVTRDELIRRFGSDVADLVIEVTDDKSLPKAERKRLQIQNAPKKSVRAQIIKLADKIANMRSILSSPPTHWDHERKKQYFEWSKQVIAGLSSPHPVLKAEFERTLKRVDELQG
jgi:(p)ppGpp synthase/HD superfamily hydrolase